MKRLDTSILVSLLTAAVLFACDPPVVSQTCPTATPGTLVYQDQIRPPVPTYPNAQNVQAITPVPPTYSLEMPTTGSAGMPSQTYRIMRFTTTDTDQQVLSFYRENLTRAGWIEGEKDAAPKTIDFLYNVESTVLAAAGNSRCAPTPEAGLPTYGVDVTIIESNSAGTIVEIRESLTPGF